MTEHNLSRRDFIKLTAVGLAVAAGANAITKVEAAEGNDPSRDGVYVAAIGNGAGVIVDVTRNKDISAHDAVAKIIIGRVHPDKQSGKITVEDPVFINAIQNMISGPVEASVLHPDHTYVEAGFSDQGDEIITTRYTANDISIPTDVFVGPTFNKDGYAQELKRVNELLLEKLGEPAADNTYYGRSVMAFDEDNFGNVKAIRLTLTAEKRDPQTLEVKTYSRAFNLVKAEPSITPKLAHTDAMRGDYEAVFSVVPPVELESSLPAGTMIHVEASEIAEAAADFMKLDADGNGTISIDGSEPISYHSKDTIFKVAGEPDKVIIAGWEYKMVGGKLEYIGPREVLAPRPDSEGNVANPAEVLPHFNIEDVDLINEFRSQTNNQEIFDHMKIPGGQERSRESLTPEYYKFRESVGSDNKVVVIPAINNLQYISKTANSVWVDSLAPAIFINGEGTCLPVAFLDTNGSNVWSNSILSDLLSVDMSIFDKDHGYLRIYLFKNNSNHEELINATLYSIVGKVQELPVDLLAKTFFALTLDPYWNK